MRFAPRVSYLYLCKGDLCLKVVGTVEQLISYILILNRVKLILLNLDSNYLIIDLKQAARKPFLRKRQLYI